MAAKFLHSLTEDSADFQKQMGCMTGIFQLFDRQHMLTGSRRIVGLTPETGIRGSGVRNSESESSTQLSSASLEKYLLKNMPEKQRIPVESSMASFCSSSLSPSSFSSFDCARATQLETDMMAQQTPDIRDFVKDSMYRELQGFKVKTTENYHSSTLDRKPSTPADVKRSLRVLAKLRDGGQFDNEPPEMYGSSSNNSRDGSSFSTSRDAPRLSCDGREINPGLLDSYDSPKSSVILQDLPRHSFDSKEVSESKSNKSKQQKSGNEARLPSIVAKLMGLETLPDSVPSLDSEGSIKAANSRELTNMPSSYQSSCKESRSPFWKRNSDSSIGAVARFPIEPAPWKHRERIKTSHKPAPGIIGFPSRAPPPVIPSVYSEINKQLEELELTESGNNLSALEQIMGTMEAKVISEILKGGQANFYSDEDLEQNSLSYSRADDSRKPGPEKVASSARRNTVSPQNLGSPIVIMKPAKLVEKFGRHSASRISLDGMPRVWSDESYSRKNSGRARASRQCGNDVNADNQKVGRTSRPQKSVKSQQLAKDGNAGLGKISGPLSPRMLKKKTEMGNKSLPPTLPDSRRSRRQPSKQQLELNSAGRKPRTMPPNLQQTDDQQSLSNFESRNLSSCNAEDLAESYETTTTSNSKPAERTGSEISPSTATVYAFADKEPALASSEEESAESGIIPLEYPSPVSVLDNRVHKLDSSPVKYVGKSLQVDVSIDDAENPKIPVMESPAAFDFNEKKLQNIESLVQKLRRLNSGCDEARTDYIALLCESSNPDHRYISEILLASGLLLRALMDFRFHPSGHPINPELFLVLEQTKGSTPLQSHSGAVKLSESLKGEKNHRKLVFDTVNEILSKKLASLDPHSEPWMRSVGAAAVKRMSSQMLLRGLCSEIESLKIKIPECGEGNGDEEWKSIINSDMTKRQASERWMDFGSEIGGAVLDVERMIFKDLVGEIVAREPNSATGKGDGSPMMTPRHRKHDVL